MADRTAIEILESIEGLLKQFVMQARASQPKPVASDRDLDGKYGDPVLKFIPRDWTGASTFKTRRFSECPPELLDMVADTFDYFAQQAEKTDERASNGKPVADYKRADAARARGWAKRMREGNHRRIQNEPIAVGVTARWAEEEGSGDGSFD